MGGVAGDDLEWRAAALRELAEEANLFLVEPTGLRTTLASTLADVKGEALYEGVVAAGGRFAADALGYLSNWVTPPGPPRRFDTRFYVVAVGEGTAATADDMEVEDARWITPGQALALGRRREWTLYRPTIKHLELLNRFATPEETVAFARSQAQVPRVAPEKSKGPGGDVEVMMPRGHGFTTAPPSEWER